MNQIEVPMELQKTGLSDWYTGLNDPTRVKVRRYLNGIDTSSPSALLTQLMIRSSEDHNYKLSASVGEYALSMEMSPMDRFTVTEAYIDGLFGSGMYEDAKEQCCMNLDLFPEVRDEILALNGGELPKKIMCRNRLIDIMVGIDSAYDDAIAILDDFVGIGILDEGELAYRRQSLKIHRMQKTFDNLFMYRPKD